MIDCKKYADEILDSVTGHGHLAVISIGNDPASQSYIHGKRKDCERVGFGFGHCAFADGVPEDDVVACIKSLNADPNITGIIVQLPVPKGYSAERLTGSVVSRKDVDGFKPKSRYKPCTPEGIVYLLHKEIGDLTGKHAVIVGRGKLVGKPLAQMLLEENMTVTVCHSKTPLTDVYRLSSKADAIIVAAGTPNYFQFGYSWSIKPDAVVVDCGIHRTEVGHLCGDVSYVSNGRYTPVPGGVGLLTRAMLIKHVERGGTKC